MTGDISILILESPVIYFIRAYFLAISTTPFLSYWSQ